MSQLGVPYRIQPGDTLWSIAETQMGDAKAWSRIYAYNCRDHVVAAGARRITNPDLIYAGSMLMLPILNESVPRTASPVRQRMPRRQGQPEQTPKTPPLAPLVPQTTLPVEFAFEFKDTPIVLNYGTFIARIRQSGRVLIKSSKSLPLTVVAQGALETTTQQTARTLFGELQSESQVAFDGKSLAITFSNKMISSATNIGSPKVAIGVETSLASGMPVLKGTIEYDELKGYIGSNHFVAMNYAVEIEIEPKPPEVRPIQTGERVPQPIPVTQVDWDQVRRGASTTAQIAAAVVLVAWGASVVFSGGTSSAAAPAMAVLTLAILQGGSETEVQVY